MNSGIGNLGIVASSGTNVDIQWGSTNSPLEAGNYNSSTHVLTVDDRFLREFRDSKTLLFMTVLVLAHELTHARQNLQKHPCSMGRFGKYNYDANYRASVEFEAFTNGALMFQLLTGPNSPVQTSSDAVYSDWGMKTIMGQGEDANVILNDTSKGFQMIKQRYMNQ